MLIRLTQKLADQLDGIDVSDYQAGDVMDLPDPEAHLLMAEGWAVAHRQPVREVRRASVASVRTVAADARSRTRAIEQARRLLRQMERHSFDGVDQRRADDQIREELHDAQSQPIK
jgi:hypothetical protein